MFSSFLFLAQAGAERSNSAVYTFGIYTLAVFFVAWLSSRLLQKKNFLSEYFLGSRGLGVWAFALTFAATSSSGGSFMGFPSLVYTHGWVLSLWIGSYMLVPAVAMGLLGKRLNQIARKTGSITIPDVLRGRFESAVFGILSTLLIVFFMSFNLVAQFKAGAEILVTLLQNVPEYELARDWLAVYVMSTPILREVTDVGYLMCLMFFSVAVILYTSYGGFRAVVWTDVMQGLVMVGGVLIMLPMALHYVGGLGNATDAMAKMTPPLERIAVIESAEPVEANTVIPSGSWIAPRPESGQPQRVFRTAQVMAIAKGEREAKTGTGGLAINRCELLEITTPDEIERIVRDMQSQFVQIPLQVNIVEERPYAYGDGQPGVYVTGPGPSSFRNLGFLPLSAAISFFFFWTFSGAGQPGNMVRLMAFNSSRTFRRAIFTVAIYYSLIYFPLVIIFCCARLILPGMEVTPDRIMPAIAEELTRSAGWPWLAGLLMAAPFAAVMSTVDSFLLMISSAAVRDVYQRYIQPEATEKTIKRLTYAVTAIIGVAATCGAIFPPKFLQDLIVFTGGGLSVCFLVPVGLSLYWRRMNAYGAVAGMLSGFLGHIALYGIGLYKYQRFVPYSIEAWDIDPFLPELGLSLLATILVSLITPPPPRRIVEKFFYVNET